MTIRMAIFQKLIYRFNETPTKISAMFFAEIVVDPNVPHVHIEMKKTQNK